MQINFALNIPDFHHCKMQDNKYFVHSNVYFTFTSFM